VWHSGAETVREVCEQVQRSFEKDVPFAFFNQSMREQFPIHTTPRAPYESGPGRARVGR
jgi:hypothetical protein